MRALPLIVLAAALGGCAAMGAEECRTADWRAIGYEDGVQGRGVEHYGRRRKACAEHGVAADLDAYLTGRTAGLAHFCRPLNGYRLGMAGRLHSGDCPVALEAAFAAANADGHGLYRRHTAVQRLRDRLRRARERAAEIERRLADTTPS